MLNPTTCLLVQILSGPDGLMYLVNSYRHCEHIILKPSKVRQREIVNTLAAGMKKHFLKELCAITKVTTEKDHIYKPFH